MPSLYDSLSQPLPTPILYGAQEASPHKTHTSGMSTAASTPPRFGVRIPVTHWHGLASRLCLQPKATTLQAEKAAGEETLVGFKSEADVVNAATLYLSNPVHLAYQLVHREDKCLTKSKSIKEETAPPRAPPQALPVSTGHISVESLITRKSLAAPLTYSR